jgi:hypothetical protein
MQSGTHALGRSFPRFKQFRVGVRFIATAENLGLYVGVKAVFPRQQFVAVVIHPVEKPAAFLVRELQHGLFKLFHAHGR